jgi:hypothetical protein
MVNCRMLSVLVGVLILASSHHARAAVITFAAPQDISGDSDVSTSGAFDRGYMFTGAEGTSVTINGVTFVRYSIASGDTQTFSSASEAFGSADAPFASLSADYQTMLRGGFFSVSTTADFTLNNLTIGDVYQVQVWVNDSRDGVTTTRNQTVSGSLSQAFNVPQVGGGLGQYLIGTFTADSSSQTISFSPGDGGVVQINGIQLRNLGSAVPEPASATLLVLGVASLGAVACVRNRIGGRRHQ